MSSTPFLRPPPPPYRHRWVFYWDLTVDEICLGWVEDVAGDSMLVQGYSMMAEVISLPSDARLQWVKLPEKIITQSVNGMWHIRVRDMKPNKPVRTGDPLPMSLPYEDVEFGPLRQQACRTKQDLLQRACSLKRKEEQFSRSRERRERHKQKQADVLRAKSMGVKKVEPPPTPRISRQVSKRPTSPDVKPPRLPPFSSLMCAEVVLAEEVAHTLSDLGVNLNLPMVGNHFVVQQ
jgi:hypothetical protein